MTAPTSPSRSLVGSVDDAFMAAMEFYRAGDRERAGRLCRQIVAQAKQYSNAWHLWGLVALRERQYQQAFERISRAVALRPGESVFRNSLGEVHRSAGEWEAALAAYKRAWQLNPQYAEAYNNQGIAAREMGRYDLAMSSYARALEIDPNSADAHWNRALLRLLLGDYKRGWPEYEWRWKRDETPPRQFAQPMWDGQPLPNGAILLHPEQGIGDALQFMRYAPLVKARCARLIVEVKPQLRALFAGFQGVDEFVNAGDPLPPFDVHTPLLSLPGLFGTMLETIPAEVPYLAADSQLVERWRNELNQQSGYKIGVVWQGSSLYSRDNYRSAPLAEFGPLAAVPGVQLYSLQKGAGSEQVHDVSFPVIDLAGRLDHYDVRFLDTSAAMLSLDLVVTTDTAPAHLAGALGVPTWLALGTMPDWRWLVGREDSPWYPTMRLFRQPTIGDWRSVFERMAQTLRTRLESPPFRQA